MRLPILALTMAFAAGGAQAATLIIDDFNGDQTVVDRPTGTQVNFAEMFDASVPGGYRDISVANDQGSFNATQIAIEMGVLGFSNTFLNSGVGSLTYDGNDNSSDVDTTGLGGFDLTFGGTATGFVYDVISADAALLITVNVWDLDGGFSSYQESLPESVSGEIIGSFADFMGDANLSNLGAIQFQAGGDGVLNLDAGIQSIGVNIAPIPLPASALLLGGALLGAGAAVRRRKSK